MAKTKIEWTEETWNPITGCTPITHGCENCYARIMAKRLKTMNSPRYENGFVVTIHNDLFNKPLTMKKPKMIFVCSMSDLFHEDVTFEVIEQLFDVMEKAYWHIFQVLTKRSKRLFKYLRMHNIPDNVWVGVSVENNFTISRINDLSASRATTKFISFEPLLEKVELDASVVSLETIDWVIVGGESGANARPIEADWVIEIKDKCKKLDIPFFFKQWGGVNKKANGCLLNGKEYKEYPKSRCDNDE